MGAAAAFAGCAGILQEDLPVRPAMYGHTVAADGLQVGFGTADISPDPESRQYLAGFGLNRRATANADPLEVGAMVIAVDGTEVAVVGLDNLGLMFDDVEWIKSGIEGIPPEHVFLCPSHVHSAPDLVGIWGYYLLTSGRDRDYLALVARGVRDAVAQARSELQPAVLHRGKGTLPDEDMVRNSNRPGVFDRDVTVLEARGMDGEPLGALLHLACHPEVLHRGLTVVSSDFVGPLRQEWADAGRGTAVFCNGALGALVSPRWNPRDQEGARTMGAALAQLALGAVAEAEEVRVGRISVQRREVYIPLRSPVLSLGSLTANINRRLYRDHLRSTVGLLHVGPVAFAAVPGEMEPTLAERLRRDLGEPDLIVLGLCDDELGYLMSEVDARDPLFDYELGMSPGADAGERVVTALLHLGQRLAAQIKP